MTKKNKIFDNPILKMISKVISWTILTLLVLFAGLLIYNIISSKIYEIRGQKYEPEIALYTIISPSMEPNINVYDVVVTKKVKDFSTIKEGDVITFISTSSLGEGLTVTHRVKSVITTDNDIKFRTQGDNNPIPDSALASSNNVLGKVIFKIPWVGHIQFMLQSKGGWLFALLIPAMIVVVYDIVKVIRLSNVKQKVNETVKEEKEDEELTKKKDNLKKKLEKKFEVEDYGEEPLIPKAEPLIRNESIFEKESKKEKEKLLQEHKNIKESKKEKVEEIIENDKIDVKSVVNDNDFSIDDFMDNVKEKLNDIDDKDNNNTKVILKNISELEDNDDFELPKTKD